MTDIRPREIEGQISLQKIVLAKKVKGEVLYFKFTMMKMNLIATLVSRHW